ncbi:MAG: hypothetical protein EXS36_20345 [Pedosphaera sp.]|nr:hypothetical protein [Pedosphaera sp.]
MPRSIDRPTVFPSVGLFLLCAARRWIGIAWAGTIPWIAFDAGHVVAADSNDLFIALQRFQQLGATHVTLHDPFSQGDHKTCVPFTLFAIQKWFDSLK